MKKIVIIIMFMVVLMSINFADQAPVKIQLDGTIVEFNDDYGFPFIDENGRTQVPLRKTLESFGAEVSWDGLKNQAIVSYQGITVDVPINKNFIVVDGEKKLNDTEARIVKERTYLPIRVVLESLKANVTWDDASRTVIVSKQEDIAKLNELESLPKGIEVGKRAYNIALKDIDGSPFNLYDLTGKNVVLAFWTTWCPSCNVEIDNLLAFNKTKNEDTVVISVNLTASDSEEAVKEFIEKKGIDFKILMDKDNQVGSQYEIVYIPSMFVLDKRGVIVDKKVGAITNEKLTEIVNSIENK